MLSSIAALIFLTRTVFAGEIAKVTSGVNKDAAKSWWQENVRLSGRLDENFFWQKNTYFNGEHNASFLETALRLGAAAKLTDNIDLNLGFYGEQCAGDAKYYTNPKNHKMNPEAEFLNFELNKLFDLPFTLTAGKQNLEFGDGFLIYDFFADHAAVYAGGMRSLPAIRLKYAPADSLKIDTFAGWVDKHYKSYEAYMKDFLTYQGKRNIFGANINYAGKKSDVWDMGLFFKNDRSYLHSNTYAFSLRGSVPLPILPELTIEAEVVPQWGTTKVKEGALSDTKQQRRAVGGHLDTVYNFKNNPFTPYVRVGYRYFPGDKPKTPGRNEAFDPMFYGFNDWGKWYGGALNGYNVFNTNERYWLFDAGFNPTKTTKIRLQYYDINLDRKNNADAGKRFSREWDIIFDWYPNDNFYCGIRFDYTHPLKAARVYSGHDSNTMEVASWVGVQF